MFLTALITFIITSMLVGGVGYALHRGRVQAVRAETTAEIARLEERLAAQASANTAAQAAAAAQIEANAQGLKDTFGALSQTALKESSAQFLQLAKTQLEGLTASAKKDFDARSDTVSSLVKPITEKLSAFDEKINQLEQNRSSAYAGLTQQVKALIGSQTQLQNETGKLSQALRTPHVRGRWGELQLRRTVELAGMTQHVDFEEQAHTTTETGSLRPDMRVRLPGGRNIIIDAKAPLESYLNALDATDETARNLALTQHAKHVKDHLKTLAGKAYWKQFQPSPEFVVCFLPGDSFFAAALQADPSLIEFGAAQQTLLATPTTLIALLKSVAYGWRQEELTKEAEHIRELGLELHERIRVMAEHFTRVGKSIDDAGTHYNKTIRSLESRVLTSARKFENLKSLSVNKPIEDSQSIDT